MKRRRTRNPSVPTPLLVIGGLAGVAALAWWATRSTAAATAQQLVASGAQALVAPVTAAQGALAYTGDQRGRMLTPEEAAAMGLIPAVGSQAETRSATLAAAMRQAADPTLSAQDRDAATRVAARLQGQVA